MGSSGFLSDMDEESLRSPGPCVDIIRVDAPTGLFGIRDHVLQPAAPSCAWRALRPGLGAAVLLGAGTLCAAMFGGMRPFRAGARESAGLERRRPSVFQEQPSVWDIVPFYRKIAEGTCGDHNMLPIVDKLSCVHAVRALELAHGITEYTHRTGVPEGCFALKGDVIVFSENHENAEVGAQMEDPDNPREPICMQDEAHGRCSAPGKSCLASKCCDNPFNRCYQKDSSWAVCKSNCTAGVDQHDPAGFRTEWTCKTLGGPPGFPDELASPRLYCFSLIMGYEVALTQLQFERGIGLFGCNYWEVYSDKEVVLGVRSGKEARSKVLTGDLSAKFGGIYMTRLNSEVFIRLWEAAFREDLLWEADWTAKLDADTVFIPSRLRIQLATANANDAVFLNNCKYGNHGPVEVISRAGMATFSVGMSTCKDRLNKEFPLYGEDVFERHCLRSLAVRQVDDYALLSEDHCDENPSPCVSGKAAFHPFKNTSGHFQCLKEALGGSSSPEVFGKQR